MPSVNRVILCAAGGGKTTRIVTQALGELGVRSALVTYTRNNADEIQRKLYERTAAVPEKIERSTWFSFLLRELVRPYRPFLHDKRVAGLHWVDGRSARYARESDVDRHYFADSRWIYSDKVAKFACACDRASRGAVIERLSHRFGHIYVDEIQDMAGFDLDLLERMLRSEIRMTLIGDHRQATYSTNNSRRHSGYARSAIAQKFREWERDGLVTVSYERQTYRCHQLIADLADSLYPSEPKTESMNSVETEHDGVFLVSPAHVPYYVQTFAPQALRLDRRTDSTPLPAVNFGESKGLTYSRVLIFPHGLARRWLSSGDLSHISGSLAKMYVGITRARHSVAFVFDGTCAIPATRKWQPRRV